jgi:hypothetical protein
MFLKEWFSPSSNKLIGFEDVKAIIKPFHQTKYTLINTLSIMEQDCLIQGTLSFDKEETVINQWIENNHMDIILFFMAKTRRMSPFKKRGNKWLHSDSQRSIFTVADSSNGSSYKISMEKTSFLRPGVYAAIC